jgi:hypothetical protein
LYESCLGGPKKKKKDTHHPQPLLLPHQTENNNNNNKANQQTKQEAKSATTIAHQKPPNLTNFTHNSQTKSQTFLQIFWQAWKFFAGQNLLRGQFLLRRRKGEEEEEKWSVCARKKSVNPFGNSPPQPQILFFFSFFLTKVREFKQTQHGIYPTGCAYEYWLPPLFLAWTNSPS